MSDLLVQRLRDWPAESAPKRAMREAADRIEADEALMRQARAFILRLSENDVCAASDHYAADRHGSAEVCPQVTRRQSLIAALRERLGEKP